MYIASQGTVESEVYHTATRASTSASTTSYGNAQTKTARKTFSFNDTVNSVGVFKGSSTAYAWRKGNNTNTLTTSLEYSIPNQAKKTSSGEVTNNTAWYFTNNTLSSSTGYATSYSSTRISRTSTSTYANYSIAYVRSYTIKGLSDNSPRAQVSSLRWFTYDYNTGLTVSSITSSTYRLTTSYEIKGTYQTRSSTYTSRTEHLTVTTNNVYTG